MADKSFKEFVLDQLGQVPDVSCRAMFGGHGLYSGGAFFGIIFQGRLFFKVDAASLSAYRDRGMDCFQPNEEQRLTSYYEVPGDVLEDRGSLAEWSARAISAAVTSRA